MAQSAKFIDVTRSFLPLDPNSYPQSLQAGRGESTPEEPIPVIAYGGQNFLPTAYGYRSFFGTAEKLNIDNLTSRVDHVILFQNITLQNILIALCDDGIWHKVGDETGAWTKAVTTYDPLEDMTIYHRWTYCILENELYAYQEGRGTFWKISSDAVTPIIFTELTPTFLNMSGQVGIFRAGSRLGFWDTDNSTAWSNLDDFADFVPSTTTLAGSSKFTDITGTIVDIRAHGSGFMIYATKSIIWIRKASDELFQWSPVVVFSNNGIVYPRQVAVASPDTLHFAYTSQGIYKIEDGKPEVIVPEVYDYFEEANSPVYLKLMQGRYLAFEIFNSDLILGKATFSNGVIEDSVLTLPGAPTLEQAIDDIIVSGGNGWCAVSENLETYHANPGDDGLALPEDTLYHPKYDANLRPPVFAADGSITYDPAVCPIVFNSETIAMQPLNGATSDYSTIFNTVSGDDAYVDGKWTMTRFVQVQSAIWDADAANLEAFRNTLLAKFETRTQVTGYTDTQSPTGNWTVTRCEGKLIPTAFSSDYQFDISPCDFALTRYALGADRVVTKKITRQEYRDTRRAPAASRVYKVQLGPSNYILHGSIASLEADLISRSGDGAYVGSENYGVTHTYRTFIFYPPYTQGCDYVLITIERTGFGSPYAQYMAEIFYPIEANTFLVTSVDGGGSGVVPNPDSPILEDSRGRYAITTIMNGSIELKPEIFSPIPDTATCELIGWDYDLSAGGSGFLPKSTACTAPSLLPAATPQHGGSYSGPFKPDANGSLCGQPYEPIVIPAYPSLTVEWPAQTVTYPGTTFILRDGTPAPLYPTAKGAYVYDLHLKKWGKYVGDYKHLLDYSPINANTSGILTDANFGIVGGILDIGGFIRLFDAYPSISNITWGKLGWNRSKMTSPEEVRVDFRNLATGYLRVQTSLDGRNVEDTLTKQTIFTEQEQATLYGCYPGKWHQITIGGWFDISYIEYKGYTQGKR